MAALALGCAGFWEPIRRHEREVSWRHAVELADAKRWDEALASIERAQLAPTLTRHLAAESTTLKGRCLSALGRREEALAHYRFVRDFFSESPEAASLPSEVRDEAATPGAGKPAAPPLDLPLARYTPDARKAGVEGSVELYYEVAPDETLSAIRVTRDAHPLLVSWAVEALAAGRGRGSQPEVCAGLAVFHFAGRKSQVKRSADSARSGPVVADVSRTQEEPCVRESSSRRSPA